MSLASVGASELASELLYDLLRLQSAYQLSTRSLANAIAAIHIHTQAASELIAVAFGAAAAAL